MTTYVLVHGAWVGEWCYDPIIPLLKEKGHIVHAVSLTGFGRKRHLHREDLTILDHIQDVVEHVETHDLTDFVLVGHSYGGGVITGAWDELRDRVKKVIYLDAGTPGDGESHFDHMLKYDGSGQIKALFGKAMAAGKKVRPFPIELLLKRNPEKAAFMKDKIMPFPLSCTTTPIHFKNGPLPTNIPKTFVLCTQNKSYHHKQAELIRADKSWRYFELNTHHDCMWEDPLGVVNILIGDTKLASYEN